MSVGAGCRSLKAHIVLLMASAFSNPRKCTWPLITGHDGVRVSEGAGNRQSLTGKGNA